MSSVMAGFAAIAARLAATSRALRRCGRRRWRRRRCSRPSSAARVQGAEAAYVIGESAFEERDNLLFGEGVEGVDAAAGEQGGDDFEGGILGGGADEADSAALDVRQEGVLLGFVEAVNFIDEEDGAGAVGGPFGVGHDLLDFLDAGEDGGELDEGGALVIFAMILARVVLPTPGGPQKIMELASSRSIWTRRGLPGPMRCSWPTNSSSVRGRMRSASGRVRSVELVAFGMASKSPMRNSFHHRGTENTEKIKKINKDLLPSVMGTPPVQSSIASYGFLCVICDSVVNTLLSSLPCGFIQYDAGGDGGVEGFDLRRVGDGDGFVHSGHQVAGQAGAFIAEKNCGGCS